MFINSVNGIYVARMIGVEQRGSFVLIVGLVALFSTIFHFGTPHASSYYIRNRPECVSFILKTTLSFQLALFLLMSLFFFLFSQSIEDTFLASYRLNFNEILGIILIATISLGNTILGPAIISKGDSNIYTFGSNVGSLFILVLNIVYFMLELKSEILLSLFYIIFAGYCITFIIYIKKFLEYKKVQYTETSLSLKDFFSFSWKSYIGAISAFSLKKVDIFIIGNFLGPFVVGLYAVAISLRELSMLIPRALTGLIGGELSDKKISNDRKEYLLNKSLFVTLLFMSAVSTILFFSFDFIIGTLYGEKFIDVVYIAKFIIWSVIPFSLAVLYGQATVSFGYPLYSSISTLLTAIFGMVLYILLIKKYQLDGILIATNLIAILLFLISFLIFRQLTKRKTI
jgi:polysaccharide transporter, PST family